MVLQHRLYGTVVDAGAKRDGPLIYLGGPSRASRGHRACKSTPCDYGTSERELVVRIPREVPIIRRGRRVVRRVEGSVGWSPGRRRGAGGSGGRGRRRAPLAVPRWPDHARATGTALDLRLVPALEVRRLRVPLRRAVVPHLAAADRTRRIVGRAGRDRRGRRGVRVPRRPDRAVARPVAALEVRGARVALGGAVVPHLARALRAARSRTFGSLIDGRIDGHARG